MFTEYPEYDRYRTLRLTGPQQRGADVFALQTALLACDFSPGSNDGILGVMTAKAISVAQEELGLTVDGLAGGRTQEALGRVIEAVETVQYRLAKGLLRGQLEHESGWRLGNYSAARDDGSYDAGVAQRNTNFVSAQIAFDVPKSIEALASNTRKFYDKFAGVSNSRRWRLAAGSWNAPAFACYLALHEGATQVKVSETTKPGNAARALLEAYMVSATAYLVV